MDEADVIWFNCAVSFLIEMLFSAGVLFIFIFLVLENVTEKFYYGVFFT